MTQVVDGPQNTIHSKARTSIFMYGFQNSFAQLFSSVSRSAIWRFHSGWSKVKVLLLDKASLDNLLASIEFNTFQQFKSYCGWQWHTLVFPGFSHQCLHSFLFKATDYFLAPLAVGQRAYVMVRCPSCVRPSVNFFFKHLLRRNYLSDFDEISQKCSHHGPLQISWNNLIPSKTLVAMATKLKIFWNLWKSSCQKP